MSILPPNASPFERAMEGTNALISDLDIPVSRVWNPATCPAELLPWLAWGVSIDFWNPDWSEQQKRDVIATSIEEQRRKGTRASLRDVLDRFDPMIRIVEWFEDADNLAPHTFRLELPLYAESAIVYDERLIAALVRDITAVKPLRSHMQAVHRLQAQGQVGLLGAILTAVYSRLDATADTTTALDPVWSNYLQSEDGEPLQDDAENFLEVV